MYRSAALAGLGLVFITGAAAAHPHVWIISKSEVIFDGDKVIAVRNIWAFDEMFSGFTVQGLDKNSDGTYTRETLQPIAEVSIGSIRNRKYYTVVKSRDTSARFDEPKDYWLEYDKEKGF